MGKAVTQARLTVYRALPGPSHNWLPPPPPASSFVFSWTWYLRRWLGCLGGVFLGLFHVSRRSHIIKLVFVFILLICLFIAGASQPRRQKGGGEIIFPPPPHGSKQVWRADLRPKEGGCQLTGQGPTLRALGMPGRGLTTGSGTGQRGSASSTGASEEPQRVKSRLGRGRAGPQREGESKLCTAARRRPWRLSELITLQSAFHPLSLPGTFPQAA